MPLMPGKYAASPAQSFQTPGVRHSAHAIMLFHQLIAGANMSGRHLFLRRELVFDHFEYPIKARQRKHQHHHATNTGASMNCSLQPRDKRDIRGSFRFWRASGSR